MLISFAFSNFLSFKDKQTLDLTPEPLRDFRNYLHTASLFDPNLRLLKTTAIYGHNNCGKSNLIKAFTFFTDLIFNSFSLGKNDNYIDFEPFRLNTYSHEQPTLFEIVFVLAETKYRYGFEIRRGQVLSEWLFYAEPKVRENYLFIRNGPEAKFSKLWNKISDNRVEQSILFTKSFHLLLSVLISQDNIPRIDVVEKWFRGNIVISDVSGEQYAGRAAMIMAQEDYRSLVNKFISSADLGFVGIQDKIKQQAGKSLDQDLLNIWYRNEKINFELYSVHEIYDELYRKAGTLFFELLKSESSGTIKYFILSCYLAFAIRHGHLVIIDELDSKFHVLLLQFLVKTYNDGSINPAGSQLIFTTHNTALLSNKLFRRDQFLVVEKSDYGESSIRRLHMSDKPIRSDASLEKEYKRGRLGGVSLKVSQITMDFEGDAG